MTIGWLWFTLSLAVGVASGILLAGLAACLVASALDWLVRRDERRFPGTGRRPLSRVIAHALGFHP